MSAGRLAAYVALAAWSGGAGIAWANDVASGFTLGVITTSVIGVATLVALVVMWVRDKKSGRITARSSR